MSRKGIFANLPQPQQIADLGDEDLNDRPLMNAANAKSITAVKKVMGDLNQRSQRADEIERKLAEGHAVVDLDTVAIDPSFAQDRMPGDIEGLKTSIREQGQQVPILVRPHPDLPGRYQAAFGHRRLRAVTELGYKVKAVVRDLTDEQLVIAQGQENNEREDLSYIEKARFADRLKDRFSRDVITASMSIDKPALSKMLSIVAAIPSELVEVIGPAPGIGRRNWQELAELIERAHSPMDAANFAMAPDLQKLPSDERFKAVISHLKPPRIARGIPGVMSTSDGNRLAQVKESKTKMEITIDKKATPDFAAFVRDQLPALYEEHQAKHLRKQGE